jgi:hypothetical protein
MIEYILILVVVILIIIASLLYYNIIVEKNIAENSSHTITQTVPQIIPYNALSGQNRDLDNPIISNDDYVVYSRSPALLSSSRPGARSLLIVHKSSINPFANLDTLFESITYPLGLLIGGSVLYSIPILNLKLKRLPAIGHSSLDNLYLREVNVICGAGFTTDSRKQLQLVIQNAHLPLDNGDPSSFWTWVNQTSTANGPLNPPSWVFELEFAARNGLIHDEPGEGEPFFDELDDMAPLALWRTTGAVNI